MCPSSQLITTSNPTTTGNITAVFTLGRPGNPTQLSKKIIAITILGTRLINKIKVVSSLVFQWI